MQNGFPIYVSSISCDAKEQFFHVHRAIPLFSRSRPADLCVAFCASSVPMSRARNLVVASSLLAFAAAGLAFPFYMATSRGSPVIDPSKPLPPQATFRGPYINTGSRDVGPDHHTYPKK